VPAFQSVKRLGDRPIRRDEQRTLAIVEDIDKPHEALQCLRLREPMRGHTVDDQDIEKGRSDIGLVRLPVHIKFPGVRVEELYTEQLMLAAPASHPLNERAEVAVAELREEPFVSLPHAERGGLSYRVAELCMRNGFFPRAARATSRKTSLPSLGEAGLGVALVPVSMRSIAPAGVRFISLKGADSSTAVALLYRRGASALVEGFAAALHAQAADRERE